MRLLGSFSHKVNSAGYSNYANGTTIPSQVLGVTTGTFASFPTNSNPFDPDILSFDDLITLANSAQSSTGGVYKVYVVDNGGSAQTYDWCQIATISDCPEEKAHERLVIFQGTGDVTIRKNQAFGRKWSAMILAPQAKVRRANV